MFVRFDHTVCSCSLLILAVLVQVFGCLNVQDASVQGHLASSGLPWRAGCCHERPANARCSSNRLMQCWLLLLWPALPGRQFTCKTHNIFGVMIPYFYFIRAPTTSLSQRCTAYTSGCVFFFFCIEFLKIKINLVEGHGNTISTHSPLLAHCTLSCAEQVIVTFVRLHWIVWAQFPHTPARSLTSLHLL